MNWVTRARPKTDRIACPWLIRRFIDPGANIVYVPADQVLTAAEQDGHSFDAPGATYTHQPAPDGQGEWCTFETLIAAHHLEDNPALTRLAAIVHAADINADLHTDPFGPGLLAIGVGGLDVESDDHKLLERGMFVYDALYAWCTRQVAAARSARSLTLELSEGSSSTWPSVPSTAHRPHRTAKADPAAPFHASVPP